MDPTLQEELEKSRKSNDTEDAFDVFFTDRLGLILARGFIKLHFTPNMVTLLSMFFGICGGILFYSQDIRVNIIGIFLEIFAAILDCSDGQVARLTNQRSRLGRILDGFSDGMCFAAMYLGLGFRLMQENIPFTDRPWGLLIWPLVLFAGGICHMGQSRMADYYRNVHLYFLNNAYGSELARSAKIREELESLPENASAFDRFLLNFYCTYTRAQEAKTPKLQRLLNHIDENGGKVPDETAALYVRGSRELIHMTNLLTYNLRAYSLYLLLMLRMHVWYLPFVILIMEAIRLKMVREYEKLAESLLPEEAA